MVFMKYVFGVIKRYYNPKIEKHTRKGRKHWFCYEFDVASGQFKRVRISTVKAIYYKITFIFGLKSKMVGYTKDKQGSLYCLDCKKPYWCIVNFWDRGIDCPYC
jgi:hypothetical protein